MAAKYVLWLDQVSRDDVKRVGTKGADIGEMFSLDLPVPSGFVVTTNSLGRLMEVNNVGEEVDRIVSEADPDYRRSLEDASRKISELITSQDVPLDVRQEILQSYESLSFSDRITDQRLLSLISAGRGLSLVAVRSSLTAEDVPTSGIGKSRVNFLNVKGKKDVLESVKKCWASFFSPDAILYRKRHGEDAGIAVVIQRMVNADKSGVIFTTDPVQGGRRMVVKSIWGLGEYLWSSEVEPDHYVVNKETGELLEERIGRKPVALMRDHMTDKSVPVNIPRDKILASSLSDDDLGKLARYGRQLEGYYGRPQDVEFAIERGMVRILQTRDISERSGDEKTATEDVSDGVNLIFGGS